MSGLESKIVINDSISAGLNGLRHSDSIWSKESIKKEEPLIILIYFLLSRPDMFFLVFCPQRQMAVLNMFC